ncbi:TIGR04086 family membrane protein [Pseudoflavonifractor sp. An85]|uniref:TIGR04086 family membrane protein n=1 Tax=Pseudoflavonifractor sp. An85 TaxID=1965661 RepID=UPI00130268EB|nr:TIGR04086 family membrane protein [Pseudoflavonifractor sp. An85]
MRKDEGKRGSPAQMVLGVALGTAIAVVVELLVLLLGAVAISGGVMREDSQLQLVALGCVLGSLVGGLVCASRWPVRKLLGGLAVGATYDVLLWLVSLARGGGRVSDVRGVVVLVCCLCGGTLAGLLCLKFSQKRPSGARRSRV